MNALRANEEAHAVAPLRLEVRGPDGVKAINLERVYQYPAKAITRAAERRFSGLLGEIPETGASFAAAPKAEQVKVIVRPSGYVEPLSSKASDPVAEPLADDLSDSRGARRADISSQLSPRKTLRRSVSTSKAPSDSANITSSRSSRR